MQISSLHQIDYISLYFDLETLKYRLLPQFNQCRTLLISSSPADKLKPVSGSDIWLSHNIFKSGKTIDELVFTAVDSFCPITISSYLSICGDVVTRFRQERFWELE